MVRTEKPDSRAIEETKSIILDQQYIARDELKLDELKNNNNQSELIIFRDYLLKCLNHYRLCVDDTLSMSRTQTDIGSREIWLNEARKFHSLASTKNTMLKQANALINVLEEKDASNEQD